ncbi:hypothetical protein SAMN02745166_03482 [Prosthecobacter debontii]|uniref:Uncharacterized protein n=1 Tax=Prosthecobacter debontii TaxID=48467 RepID=A0A1T4YJ87_9BACT|nr:hypothetical protein [Prosthecobacter debontii]SKB01849.1 hypothetical protein SAMN02745166_03482 [Prosthecobacter debontii]
MDSLEMTAVVLTTITAFAQLVVTFSAQKTAKRGNQPNAAMVTSLVARVKTLLKIATFSMLVNLAACVVLIYQAHESERAKEAADLTLKKVQTELKEAEGKLKRSSEDVVQRVVKKLKADFHRCLLTCEEEITKDKMWAPNSGAKKEAILGQVENIRANMETSLDRCEADTFALISVFPEGEPEFQPLQELQRAARQDIVQEMQEATIGEQSLDQLRTQILNRIASARKQLVK